MKTNFLIITLLLITLKSFGQDINTEKEQKDIKLIVSSYEEHSERSESIKYSMVLYRNIHKILLLKEFSNQVIKSFDVKFFNEKDYYFLCFFDSIPDSIIDISIKNRSTPLIFKAKYGDSSYAKKLLFEINNYFFSTSDNKLSDNRRLSYEYISYLFLLKGRYIEADKILCKILQSSKYTQENLYDGRQDYKISISYIAIKYYFDFYPPSNPISKINLQEFEVSEGKPIFSIEEMNTMDFNQFKLDFEQYFFQIEGTKIKINTTFFNLGEYRVEKYEW